MLLFEKLPKSIAGRQKYSRGPYAARPFESLGLRCDDQGQLLHLIYTTRIILNIKALKLLYYSFAYSYLIYWDIAQGSANLSHKIN